MKSSSLKRGLALSSLLFVAVALLPSLAAAQGSGPFAQPPGPNGFGAAGQILIDGTASFSLIKVSGGNTSITLKPALDYFIIPNVTIGGVVGLTTESGRFATTTILLGARAGINFNLGDKFSLWPTAGFTFAHSSISDGGPSNNDTAFNLYAPFLFHVAPHFFLGVGPFLDVGLGEGDSNVFGFQSLIGGWF